MKTLALVGTALSLMSASSAVANAPRNGYGFGLGDPDPNIANSLNLSFEELKPKTFRIFANYGNLSGAGDVSPEVESQRAEERIRVAHKAGVEEVLLTITVPPSEDTTPGVWINTLTPYIARIGALADSLQPRMKLWWSPANEPNHLTAGWMNTHPHTTTRPRPIAGWGTDVLADYMDYLAWHLALYRPADRLVSPEFADHYVGDQLDNSHQSGYSVTAHYIQHYREAGGWFGEMVGWHPYEGVKRQSMLSTTDLSNRLDALGYGSTPIWVTEVGVHENDDVVQQDARVAFIVNSLAGHTKVNRINYYHVRDHNPAWDSALVTQDGRRRPAWFTWCSAARNYDAGCYDDSPSAASWGPGRLDVFFRGLGDDRGVHGRSWDSGSWWDGPIGGIVSSGPAVVAPARGLLEVYARGGDNTIWYRRFTGTSWSSWTLLGGVTHTSPAASFRRGTTILDTFHRGTDNAVWHRARNGQTWSDWASLGAPPGGATSAPASVSMANGRVDAFVRGGDYALWRKTFVGSWGAWTSIGGAVTSAPAVTSRGVNRIDLFVRGIGGTTFHRTNENGVWSAWSDLGAISTSAPAAAAPSADRVDVWIRGQDTYLYHKYWTPTTGWRDWSLNWYPGP